MKRYSLYGLVWSIEMPQLGCLVPGTSKVEPEVPNPPNCYVNGRVVQRPLFVETRYSDVHNSGFRTAWPSDEIKDAGRSGSDARIVEVALAFDDTKIVVGGAVGNDVQFPAWRRGPANRLLILGDQLDLDGGPDPKSLARQRISLTKDQPPWTTK